MRIGPSLILASRQTPAMTPQLQQAIKLLQFSHLELAAFIQQELEKNPLLAEGAADDGPIAEQDAPIIDAPSDTAEALAAAAPRPGRGRRALDARACRPRRRRGGKPRRPARRRAQRARFRLRAAALARRPCAGADRADVRRCGRAAHCAEARRRPRRGGLLPPRCAGRRRGRAASASTWSRRCGPGCARSSRPACSPAPSPSASARSSPSAIAWIRR